MEKRDVVVYSEDYKKLVDAAALKDKYYEIDERVEEICKEAFKGCDKLEEIVMPKKLKKIDSEAFQGCSSLTKLTLPDSVARIDGLAFSECSGLSKITSLAGIPPVFDRCMFVGEEFGEVNKANCELIVPEESITAYKQAKGWNEFSNIRGFVGEKK